MSPGFSGGRSSCSPGSRRSRYAWGGFVRRSPLRSLRSPLLFDQQLELHGVAVGVALRLVLINRNDQVAGLDHGVLRVARELDLGLPAAFEQLLVAHHALDLRAEFVADPKQQRD